MNPSAKYIVVTLVGVALSLVHYFAVANQYIAGGTVNNYYIINAAYIVWTIIFIIASMKGKFIWSFFSYLLIIPLISIVGREVMYIGSIGFTVILAISFAGFRKIVG